MELLFKAKIKDNGEWVQGYYYVWEQGYILWGMTNNVPNMIEIDLETLCQYTGMNDKNENKIWGNDIVKDKDGRYVVKYYEDDASFECFGIDGDMVFSLGCVTGDSYEVVGNIFDNPELMEV